MTNFLLRRFVPDYQNTADPAVREKYGNLAGIVGIVCNVLLFAGRGKLMEVVTYSMRSVTVIFT